jgi:hypothetical protein
MFYLFIIYYYIYFIISINIKCIIDLEDMKKKKYTVIFTLM